MNAIFGAYTSGVQIAMDPICAKYQVPCIAGSAESPGIWKKQPAFTFGVIPAVDTTAARSIQAIVDTANPKPATAAVVGANEPFSDDTAEGFRAGAEAREAATSCTSRCSRRTPTWRRSPAWSRRRGPTLWRSAATTFCWSTS